MRAARIYRPAELIGGKVNHLQVQACHGPAKGSLLGRGQRCHTLAAQPRLGRACGRGDRSELRRSPRICPEQEGGYLGSRSAVNRCWREQFRTQCARDRVLLRTAGAQRVERPGRAQALGPTKETLRMKRSLEEISACERTTCLLDQPSITKGSKVND